MAAYVSSSFIPQTSSFVSSFTPQPASFFSVLWSKICEVASRIFHALIFWKKPSTKLTEKQIRIIDTIKTKPTRYFVPKQTIPIPVPQTTSQVAPSVVLQNTADAAKKNLDPALEQLRQCFQDIAVIGGEVVYEQHIEKTVKLIKNQTAEIPDLMNFVANLISQIGNKASQNFFKRVGPQRSQAVSGYIKTLMISLLKSSSPEAVRASLESQLDERIGKMTPPLKLPFDQTLKMYSKPIIDELLNIAEKNEPLKVEELFLKGDISPDFKIIDTVFETAARLIVEIKIKQFLGTFQSILVSKMDVVVSKAVKINAKKISDILVCRIAELLQNMAYPPTFDKIITILNQQMESIISSEKIVDDLIAKSKLPDPAKADAAEMERLRICRKEIQSLGEEKFKQIKLLKAFSTEKGCHPIMSNMIHMDKNDIETIEEIVSNDMADDYIKLLFPKKKVSVQGKIVELDGVDYLWQQLIFPDECLHLLGEVKELIEHTMTSDSAKSFTNLKSPLYHFIENVVVNYVQEQIKAQLTLGIKMFFQNIVSPKFIKQTAAEKFLPMALDSMIPVFAQMIIAEELDKVAPLFKLAVETETSPEAHETLLKTLYELWLSKAVCYKQAGSILTEAKFKETVNPVIAQIKTIILSCRNTEETANKEIIAKLQPSMLNAFKYSCAQFVTNTKQADTQAYTILTNYVDEFSKQIGPVEQIKKDLIMAKLKEKLKALFQKAKEVGAQPEEAKAAAQIEPFVDEIKTLLHNKNISLEALKAQINQYLASTVVKGAPPVYGDLMMNLAFGIGKFEVSGIAGSFSNLESIKAYMNEMLRDILFRMVKDVRKGYEEPVSMAVYCLKQTLNNKQQMLDLIGAAMQTTSPNPSVIDESFHDQLNKVSALVFDIISKVIDLNIGYMNPLRSIVKGAIGADSSQIKKTALNCFTKLTQDKLLLENIVLKVMDTFMMALNEADAKMRAKQPVEKAVPPTNPLVL